jgi:hypothetical protein
LSHTDLRSFTALVESAALRAKAYREAMRVGPIIEGERGCKTAPQWSAWVAASGVYRGCCKEFGLLPMAARHVDQAAPPRHGKLTVVS